MNEPQDALVPFTSEISLEDSLSDPGASPFKLVVDPLMRTKLRKALFELIESHDLQLARHFSEGSLSLDSYKEYIEIFASSLKQTMESREGVGFLMQSCGFEVKPEDINLQPETRWK